MAKQTKRTSLIILASGLLIGAAINVYLQQFAKEMLWQPLAGVVLLTGLYFLVRDKNLTAEFNKTILTYTILASTITMLDLLTTHQVISARGLGHEASNIVRFLLTHLPNWIVYLYTIILNTTLFFLLIQVFHKNKHTHYASAFLALYSLVIINNLYVMMKI